MRMKRSPIAMRSLGPQELAAIFQPDVQRIHIRKGGHGLPEPVAGIAHILLDLTFLPPCRWIAELGIKDIMAGHRQEPCVCIPRLSDTNPVDGWTCHGLMPLQVLV